jgi:predicted amidohydrolase YtcJ
VTAHEPADLVLWGGRIQAMDARRSIAGAVAVRGGRIVAVGEDAAVGALIGPRTRVVQLRDRTVTPGFGDAHVHPVSSGLTLLRCGLDGVRGLDRYLELVADYAAAHPDEPWIQGDGWSMADFPGGMPRREDLDRIIPDRPIYLDSRDGHSAWVNSAALERAGIGPDTLDPVDGRIERDPDGRPIGTLQEGARPLVYRLLPPATTDQLVEALGRAQAHLHALGVTNWQDAAVEPDEGGIAYPALVERGLLSARVVGALEWDDKRGDDQIDELVERRAHGRSARYAPTSVKIFQDGIIENGTAGLLEPYLGPDGRPTTDRGQSLIDPAAFAGHVTRLDALGFQVHVHAIGDRAVREALDAVAAARRANGMTDTRPTIAHIQVIHPDDIGRFRALGVVANAQPYWACHEDQMDTLTIPRLGAERAARQYPFGSLLAAGATLAMGSDWAVSTANPLLEMEIAVTRVSDLQRGERAPFLPDERIKLIDALAAFTLGTAWVNHLETEVGSLEVGKAADLVVLDRDLFDRGAGAIGEARVVATFIDGAAVHETPALGG